MRPSSSLTIDVSAAQKHDHSSIVSALLRSPATPFRLSAIPTTASLPSFFPCDENMTFSNACMVPSMLTVNFTPVMPNFRSFMPVWSVHNERISHPAQFGQAPPLSSFGSSFPGPFNKLNGTLSPRNTGMRSESEGSINPKELFSTASEAPKVENPVVLASRKRPPTIPNTPLRQESKLLSLPPPEPLVEIKREETEDELNYAPNPTVRQPLKPLSTLYPLLDSSKAPIMQRSKKRATKVRPIERAAQPENHTPGKPGLPDDGPRYLTRYHCVVCDKHYGDLKHLYRHQQSHVPQPPIECVWCNRTFTRKDTLQRHLHTCTIRPIGFYKDNAMEECANQVAINP